MQTEKQQLNFIQMMSLNFGMLGVQFAFALAVANMSGIFSFFGAQNNRLGYLWLLPTILSLIIPIIVGYLSDRTSSAFGKRMPYIFIGVIFTAISMFLLPNSSSINTAVILLCIFTAAINMALQPYRPLVVDIVPSNLHTKIYSIQAAMIGIGAMIASAAPWIILHLFSRHAYSKLPFEIIYSFYIGAIVILLSNLCTAVYVKKNMSIKNSMPLTTTSVKILWREKAQQSINYIINMPQTMWRVSLVQIFTWLGTFCFIIFFTPAIEETIFHISPLAHVAHNAYYKYALEKSTVLTGLSCAFYMLVNVIFASCIPALLKIVSRKKLHIFALTFGGLSLIAINFIHHTDYLFLAMIGVGVAWASFNSIPFAMIAGVMQEEKMGLAMGLFNISVCLPQIAVSLFAGVVLSHLLHNRTGYLIVISGIFFLIAALLTCWINDGLGSGLDMRHLDDSRI
ncbi:MAG: MFS transporter [Gammaproteobacteria bacterium]|nr:MFS transporter [Gammaproteobacteria bacterium]